MASLTKKPSTPNDARTRSELLFEHYLKEQALQFEFEPETPGCRKKPDYRVCWNGNTFFCEVKELHARRPEPSGAVLDFDPCRGIRKEIHEARKQFREYQEHCCVLVIYNVDDWEFQDWPIVLFEAMLGDLGLQFRFDRRKGVMLEPTGEAFLGGGKMIDPKRKKPQNRTISAIAVLSELTIWNPEFEREYESRCLALHKELGAEPTIEQRLGIRMKLYEPSERLPVSLGKTSRVEVFENPFARIKLPKHVFMASYDSRFEFNPRLGRIVRTFAGDALKQSEEAPIGGDDVLQKIEQFKQGIVERFNPQQIVLFGSYAYGCPEPDSDVDLLVVFAGDGNVADRSLDIRKQLPCDFPLDLLTRSAGEIERRLALGDSFLQEILDHGKTLYEA